MSIYEGSHDEETAGELVLELDEDQSERFQQMRESVNRDTRSDMNEEEFLNWVLEQAGRFTFP